MQSPEVSKSPSNWPAIENGIRDYLEENNTTKGKRLDEVERAMRTTATTPSEAGNKDEQAESSGSEAETEPARSFHRKLSTNRAIKNAICWTKEGFLMKQTWSFQRWRRKYFKLRDRTLYYAKDAKVRKMKRLLKPCNWPKYVVRERRTKFPIVTDWARLHLNWIGNGNLTSLSEIL